MKKEDFDDTVSEYYDRIIEKGYHNNAKYLSDLLKMIKKGERVLELGSGTGMIFLELVKQGILMEGIDISNAMTERLKAKNKNAIIHISSLEEFMPEQEYEYVFSCNGPFSIKEEEIESYILDKEELVKIVRKYIKMAKKGLLINKGKEKPARNCFKQEWILPA